MNRHEALEAASKAVSGRRAYGPPESNFHRIARRWSVHILNRYGVSLNLSPDDVAVMCIDLKLSRIEETPDHPDSWVDAAGYAACGAEITSGAVAEWGEPVLPSKTIDAPLRHHAKWKEEIQQAKDLLERVRQPHPVRVVDPNENPDVAFPANAL